MRDPEALLSSSVRHRPWLHPVSGWDPGKSQLLALLPSFHAKRTSMHAPGRSHVTSNCSTLWWGTRICPNVTPAWRRRGHAPRDAAQYSYFFLRINALLAFCYSWLSSPHSQVHCYIRHLNLQFRLLVLKLSYEKCNNQENWLQMHINIY